MIFLLRHGEIEGKGAFVGQVDLPLTEKGLMQARAWQQLLEATVFDRIYCSDLQRSRRTAEIISGNSQANVHIMPQLREINMGEWDGIARSDIRARFPEKWRKRGENLASYRPDKGESFADLSYRVVPVFENIVKQTEGTSFIVGHAGVNRIILCYVLGMPLSNIFRIDQDYGCLNIIDCERGFLRVKGMNFLIDRMKQIGQHI